MGINLADCWANIQNDDERALESLFKDMNSSLCAYIFHITKDWFIAQEITQDLFLKLWQNRATLDITDSLKSYLYKSAHNLALNFLVQRNTLKHSVNKLLPEDLCLSIHNELDINAFLIESIEAEETEQVINIAIQALPEHCRDIFIKSRHQGMSIEEISQELNITTHTVRTQIYRALDKIREALEKMK